MYGFGPLDFPLPERPRGAPPPPEPAGGWSEDPITRAAQHISYGHAGTRHLGEWPPGTTREQLAAEIERIMRAATHPNSGMVVGRTPDGAPAIYDPKTNTLVIRDAHANDAGTAFKPTNPKSTLASKVATRLPNIPASELGLEPRPPGEPSRPQPPRPPSRGGMPPIFVPPQIVPLPGPGSGGLPPLNSGGLPDLDAPGQ